MFKILSYYHLCYFCCFTNSAVNIELIHISHLGEWLIDWLVGWLVDCSTWCHEEGTWGRVGEGKTEVHRQTLTDLQHHRHEGPPEEAWVSMITIFLMMMMMVVVVVVTMMKMMIVWWHWWWWWWWWWWWRRWLNFIMGMCNDEAVECLRRWLLLLPSLKKLSLLSCFLREDVKFIEVEIRQLSEQYSIKCLENAAVGERLKQQTTSLHENRKRVQDLLARLDWLIDWLIDCSKNYAPFLHLNCFFIFIFYCYI